MASKEDAIFCKIAVKNKLLTVEQCKECERIRKEEGGGKTLSRIFIEKGYLSDKMAQVIFNARERIKASVEKENPIPAKDEEKPADTKQAEDKPLGEYSYELIDSDTAYKLTPVETGDTIHPDIVKEGDTNVALPPKIIGEDTFYENLSDDQREELEGLQNLPDVPKGGNVVYNVNVQNTSNPPAVPDETSMTLHRNELTESQLLALIKGERINLPAIQQPASAPVQHLMVGQHTLLAAMQKNTLFTLLAVGILVIMFGIGMFALIYSLNRPKEKTDDNSPVIVAQPAGKITEKPLIDVIALFDSNSPSIRKQVVEELSRRARENKEYRAIEVLVEALGDEEEKVWEAARSGLLGLSMNPENSAMVRNTCRQLDKAFRSDPKNAGLKKRYLYLLDTLEYDEDDLLKTLNVALKDKDVGVRSDAMTYLKTIDKRRALDLAVFALSDNDPGIVKNALNLLWEKRDRYPATDIFKNLLARREPEYAGPLCRVLVFLADKKVQAYLGGYGKLVLSGADVTVKTTAVNALKEFGPQADGFIYTPFDTALHAHPKDAVLRDAIVEACRAIRGVNSDRILVEKIIALDADPKRTAAARGIIEKSGTDEGKNLLLALDKNRHQALVDAKIKDLNSALQLLTQGRRLDCKVGLEKILADKNPKIVDEALKKTTLANRANLEKMYVENNISLGWVKVGSVWKDPRPEWNAVKSRVEVAKNEYRYPDAIKLLDSFSIILLDAKEIKAQYDKTRDDVIKHGQTQSVLDLRRVKDFILRGKLEPDAKKLMERMKTSYTRDVFKLESVPKRADDAEMLWINAEREKRSWIFQIDGNTSNDQLKGMIGKEFKDYGNYSLKNTGGLRICFNPKGTSANSTYSISFSFNLKGQRNIRDFGALQYRCFVSQLPDAGHAEVKITVSCASGAVYEWTRTFGVSSGIVHNALVPGRWKSIRDSGTPSENPFKPNVTGISMMITIKNPQKVKRSFVVRINDVKFEK